MSLLWPVASPVLWFKEMCRASNAVTVELGGGVRKEKSLVLLHHRMVQEIIKPCGHQIYKSSL